MAINPGMHSSTPRSTVVVVTWRGRDLIGPCLDALRRQTRSHRVLVVDNASDDGTAAELARHPSGPGVLRLAANVGYAGALAAALPQVDTEFMAWLNDDARPEPRWLAALEDTLAAEDTAGAVSSCLRDATGSSIGVRLTRIGYGADTAQAPPFGFCGGAVLLRLAALNEVGGVPAGYFCYYEDTDTSWRLRLAGYSVVHADDAAVTHLGGASARHGSPDFHRWNERNRILMLVRCAPAVVAARELARFAALTAVLPLRRDRPPTPNFEPRLRWRVLTEVIGRLPATLRQRRRIGRRARVPRQAVWTAWAR